MNKINSYFALSIAAIIGSGLAHAGSERARDCNSVYIDRMTPFLKDGAPSIAVYVRIKTDVLRLNGVKAVNFVYAAGGQPIVIAGERFFNENYWKIVVPVKPPFGQPSLRGDIYAEGNMTTSQGKSYRYFVYSQGSEDFSAEESLLEAIRTENSSGRPFADPPFIVFDRGLFDSLVRDSGHPASALDGPEQGVGTFGNGYRHYNPQNCQET